MLEKTERTSSIDPSFAKVYRRVNDPAKNVSHYSANLAATYVPFHLHSSLIRFTKFRENGFFVSTQFENKMLSYVREIVSGATHSEYTVASNTRFSKSLKCALLALLALCSILNCEDGFIYLALLITKLELVEEPCGATNPDRVSSSELFSGCNQYC